MVIFLTTSDHNEPVESSLNLRRNFILVSCILAEIDHPTLFSDLHQLNQSLTLRYHSQSVSLLATYLFEPRDSWCPKQLLRTGQLENSVLLNYHYLYLCYFVKSECLLDRSIWLHCFEWLLHIPSPLPTRHPPQGRDYWDVQTQVVTPRLCHTRKIIQ